jgi:hypothetical protein
LFDTRQCLVTVAGRYPKLAPVQTNWFMKILEWATPSGVYTNFGTMLWLAYPIFMLARILDLDAQVNGTAFVSLVAAYRATWQLMLVPALLYLWHESAQGVFIISCWREQLRKSARTDDSSTNVPAVAKGVSLEHTHCACNVAFKQHRVWVCRQTCSSQCCATISAMRARRRRRRARLRRSSGPTRPTYDTRAHVLTVVMRALCVCARAHLCVVSVFRFCL